MKEYKEFIKALEELRDEVKKQRMQLEEGIEKIGGLFKEYIESHKNSIENGEIAQEKETVEEKLEANWHKDD